MKKNEAPSRTTNNKGIRGKAKEFSCKKLSALHGPFRKRSLALFTLQVLEKPRSFRHSSEHFSRQFGRIYFLIR